MALGIFIVILLVVSMMSFSGRQQVAWANTMRRVNAGVAHKSEWLAPESIMRMVRDHYMESMRWLPESVFYSWSQQWASAPEYLSGMQLKRHHEILKYHQVGKPPRYIGVLRCTHQPDVCSFSEDGERCLVVDTQTSRRMATYDYWTQDRVNTQDLGDAVIVHEMVYDRASGRWKIDRYIQELPLGWRSEYSSSRLQVVKRLPHVKGRDY